MSIEWKIDKANERGCVQQQSIECLHRGLIKCINNNVGTGTSVRIYDTHVKKYEVF